MRIRNLLALSLIVLLTATCKEKKPAAPIISNDEVLQGTTLAEPIIYDMVIKNVSPDDEWAEENLRNLDREKLITIIFDAVYNERLIAYDFYTDAPMKVSEVKKLEKVSDFSRDKIGKLQFKEDWAFNESTLQFQKKVISMLLAYEVFNSAGELRGYKPVFYVKLN